MNTRKPYKRGKTRSPAEMGVPCDRQQLVRSPSSCARYHNWDHDRLFKVWPVGL